MSKRLLRAALISTLLSSSSANAADVTSRATPEGISYEHSGWAFSFSPYFWAAGLSGDFGQFNLPTIELDQRFGEILSDLDFSTMVFGEARSGSYSLLADIQYTKVSSSSATPRGVVASSVDLTSQTFSGLFAAGYAVIGERRTTVDLVAGARLWHASTEITFSGGLLDGVDRSDSATWVDGMVGVRGRYAITDRSYLRGWVLIGAGDANLDWDAAVVLGYHIGDRLSAIVGYRALGVDYDRNGFVFDALQQGPLLGLTVTF